MLYMLTLSLWNASIGMTEVKVIDYAMTGAACIAALEANLHLNNTGVLACEIDEMGDY